MRELTPRQLAILDYLKRFYMKTGVAPTLVQIKREIDISSTSVVAYNLNALIQAGELKRVGGYADARSIVPVVDSWRELAQEADGILDKLHGANGFSDAAIEGWRGRYAAMKEAS